MTPEGRMDPRLDELKKALEARSAHTIRLYANQRDDSGTDYRVLLIQQAVDVVEELLASPVPSPSADAKIDCPLCGVTVQQVASATLSLALWQHVNWVCAKRPSADARAKLEQDIKTVAGFIVGYFPGYEDGIAWGNDTSDDGTRPEHNVVYQAAKRLLALPPHEGETPQTPAVQAYEVLKDLANGLAFDYDTMPEAGRKEAHTMAREEIDKSLNILHPPFREWAKAEWDAAQRESLKGETPQPAAERGTWFPCPHCGSGTCPLLDSVDSGTTLICDNCGGKTVVDLQPLPLPPVVQTRPEEPHVVSVVSRTPVTLCINHDGYSGYTKDCPSCQKTKADSLPSPVQAPEGKAR